jgi:hypothetical protein
MLISSDNLFYVIVDPVKENDETSYCLTMRREPLYKAYYREGAFLFYTIWQVG